MKLETIVSCRTDIYFDYQLIDVATEKILETEYTIKHTRKATKKNGKNTINSNNTNAGQLKSGV